ncbi:hypothetical protein G6F68_016733 [Rhizopus microsporus]|nr:hypothetical protein G6F68_016733 [Rhizopus microsporus]
MASRRFAFDVQAGAHAVVYRQRLAGHAVDQAVIGIGKRAVVVETGDAAPGQDGGQARVLVHGKAPAQRVLGQAVHRNGAQMVFFLLKQGHRAATKMRAQAGDQPLQADGRRQGGDQVGKQEVMHGVDFTVQG